MKRQVLMLVPAVALLSSCGQQAGNDAAQPDANAATASAAETPAPADGISLLVYPGAQRAGDRFSTADPIDQVVGWYWDEDQPVRERDGQTWVTSKPERREDGYLIGVTIVDDEHGQTSYIYLNPRAGGGTEGRVRQLTDEEQKSGVKL